MKAQYYLKIFIGISCIYILLISFCFEDFAWYLKPFLLPFLFYAVVDCFRLPPNQLFFLGADGFDFAPEEEFPPPLL